MTATVTTIIEARNEARRARNEELVLLLGYILGEIQKKEKAVGAQDVDYTIPVIKAHVRQCQDFCDDEKIEESKKCQHRFEIEYLSKFLPQLVGEEQLVKDIKEYKAKGLDNKGAIMKALKEKHGECLNAKLASSLI